MRCNKNNYVSWLLNVTYEVKKRERENIRHESIVVFVLGISSLFYLHEQMYNQIVFQLIWTFAPNLSPPCPLVGFAKSMLV